MMWATHRSSYGCSAQARQGNAGSPNKQLSLGAQRCQQGGHRLASDTVKNKAWKGLRNMTGCRTISDCVWEIRLRPPAAKQRSRLCRRLHTVQRRPRERCAEPSRTTM